MKVISVLSQKGGSGKSTLCAHYGVEAERVGPSPAVLVDLDPQASLRQWHETRDDETPVLIDIGNRSLGDVVEACRTRGAELVIVDTAPHVLDSAYAAASVSDLCIVSTRASIFDIRAIEATVEIVRKVKKPAVIVLNAVRPRGPLTDEARQALKVYGLEICPTAIVHRAALADALIDGRGVQELDPLGKAADEITKSWKWIKRRL